ncbi:peptide transporter MTD1 [Pyricularia oryzae 70-15]|uniref:Peptide transporter MTD1 n=1 Tax=Pyricularia oryzae (strain 70-15 / ATCC MYA-4617 / FGSC 8958) TaxID=242507 RepID=G4ND12_PYRO7|nr:peptide transporter MTD1 [Pyricularia oryzae 70-15]EHA49202.1 peptide transporter MTD1 [Pyricularia oryzae 70-15]
MSSQPEISNTAATTSGGGISEKKPGLGKEVNVTAVEVDSTLSKAHASSGGSSSSSSSSRSSTHEKNSSSSNSIQDSDNEDVIIISGEDVSNHLLPLRDDGDAALTFRSIFLATCLAAFESTLYQIYQFKPTEIEVSSLFIVLIAHFAGTAWASLLPRGDRLEARWRAGRGSSSSSTGAPPLWIRIASVVNPGPWGLKEHAICAITAASSSNAAEAILAFTAQDLFYDLELKPVTVVLSIISISLFGYGICGLIRPIAVWHVDAVYWSSLPVVKTVQSLHWQEFKTSKPLRVFWIAFACMFVYEFLPAYMWPWLNSVSIPCLAAMHATGDLGATLTRFFGGSINNEGLGLFSLSFDWQYITSYNTSLPLITQLHTGLGFGICMIGMVVVWYTNAFNAQSQPFMSTRLHSADGSIYPISQVFEAGQLDHAALERFGLPQLSGTFVWGLFMANAAIGGMITHCAVFYAKDIINSFKSANNDDFKDRHHNHMKANYKEAPWWWFAIVLFVSFSLGLIVVTTQNITLPWWAFMISLLLGCIIAPLSTMLFSRFGLAIATNNLSKMLAGLIIPERPIGTMYFAAWSHSVISSCHSLCNDLKIGEYLKIPPRDMFLTQVYGTILGGFINYGVMSSIVKTNRDLLVNSDGNNSWSGATIQSYNTNAATWALAKYLYAPGGAYSIVPLGLVLGVVLVLIHRAIVYFVPKIKGWDLAENINLPQLLTYCGEIPIGATQTCVIFSQILGGLFAQFYLRNYRPRIFKNYFYSTAGAFDGAALSALFLLSFAMFGAAGPAIPFPKWWGNRAGENYDFCPKVE